MKPTNLRERLAWVNRFRRALVAHEAELCETIEREVEKPPFEALVTDLVGLLSSCVWHERHARRILRPISPIGPGIFQLGQSHRIHRAPLGHVAIIATWNYPVQLLGVQLVQAVVGGNRITVKPSERCPETHALLLDLAADARPPTTIDRVPATREAGAALLEQNTFDHVVFTGSTAVGRHIASTLAPRLTPSTLELSGSDSALILRDADPSLAAKSLWFALTLNAGQTCMAPRRVIIHRDQFDRFVAALIDRSRAFPLDTPDNWDEADSVVPEAIEAGGERIDTAGHVPIIVADPPKDSALARGEHFGPAMALFRAKTDQDALAIHHDTATQALATSVFTATPASAREIAPALGSGVVTINDAIIPTGHPGTSIGGHGQSGWGWSRGEAGLLSMTRPLYISNTSKNLRAPLDPPDPTRLQQIRRFVRFWYGR